MNNEIAKSLKSKFPKSILSMVSEDKRILIAVKREEIYEVLTHLKDLGFDHLSDVTCIDYISEEEFEIIYHLWSHGKKLRCLVRIRTPRKNPVIKSVIDLWEGAQIHERENNEMFGLDFKGNPNLSPLFLEDWEEIPPLRKDFDTREYVKKHYYGGD